MLTLYTKASCPFCRRVVAVLDRLAIDVEMKDIAENDEYREELIAHGGQQMVPYLVDTDADIAMYESDDIVSYLQKTYGTTTPAQRPRVHVSDSTCVSCEG